MGYTHYWKYENNISATSWNTFLREMRVALGIFDPHGTLLAGGDGKGHAVLDLDIVMFNGKGEDRFESMVLYPEDPNTFEFCKTGRRPYDTFVVATLMLAKKNGILKSWSSDGEDEDMVEGKKLFNEILRAMRNAVNFTSGGYHKLIDVKTSKNKPKMVAKVLYNCLNENGWTRKKTFVALAKTVNNRNDAGHGYCASTIAWHTGTGRFERRYTNGKTWFRLTDEGRKYATERGIL